MKALIQIQAPGRGLLLCTASYGPRPQGRPSRHPERHWAPRTGPLASTASYSIRPDHRADCHVSPNGTGRPNRVPRTGRPASTASYGIRPDHRANSHVTQIRAPGTGSLACTASYCIRPNCRTDSHVTTQERISKDAEVNLPPGSASAKEKTQGPALGVPQHSLDP